MDQQEKLEALKSRLETLYTQHKDTLLFHGLHHITFVSKKARIFAESIGADQFLVESAGLVHDLNYIVETNSEPEKGQKLRVELLSEAGYSSDEIDRIEKMILETHTATRGVSISQEGMALSDGDTLFKALPITPIMFSSKYIQQNKVDVKKLARKVVSEQQPLLEQGIYFYTDLAKEKYLKWAKVNLELWGNVEEALQDEEVQELITIAQRNGVL